MKPYLFALTANMSFALGSIFFTHYARKFNSTWMNTYKAFVAAIFFALAVIATTSFHQISLFNIGVFFTSGFIALGVGDIFLLKAFSLIGPGRTMVLFGFHPLVVGAISYLAFGQSVASAKLIGILFFILCLITFSYETFKKSGRWEIHGLVYALLGMCLDAIGVTITRYGFELNEAITGFEGNFYRCLGALFSYFLISLVSPFNFFGNIKSLNWNSRSMVTLGAMFGTFLSLAFYLEAIKESNVLASISAISITSVIFASLFECIYEKKLPSKYLYIAFVFFGFGMYFILFQ